MNIEAEEAEIEQQKKWDAQIEGEMQENFCN